MSVQAVPAASRRFRPLLTLAALSGSIALIASAAAATFSNPALVFVNDRWGIGSPPYPSVINVSGMSGFIYKVTVTLTSISHTNPDDLDILLVGPTGAAAVVMSDAGGSQDAVNVTLTLDADDPPAALPDEGPLVSGTFAPTNYGNAAGADTFPDYGPSPGPPWPFVATTANGAWRLYVVDDETNDTGSIAGGWSLAVDTGMGPVTFSNPAAINVSDAQSVGKANPYPSSVVVSGLVGNVADVNATLTGFTHTFPADVDVLLVGPTGANTKLMSDACGSGDLAGNLTFDDGASSTLTDTGQCAAGSYKPSDYVAGDTFPAPAPAANAAVALANFNGTAPNGAWSLYVVDDAGLDVGRLTGGWSLDITASGPTAVELASFSATPVEDGVAVRWRTVAETSLAGFDVYRGSRKLNGSRIAARQSGTARGASYVYVDRTAPAHGSLTYRIQLVRVSGARSLGAATTLVRSG